jgi:4'-phosphopantetheinyl transferase
MRDHPSPMIGPGSLRLPAGDVHVWRATVPTRPFDLAEDLNILSTDERTRADRFRAVGDRARFVAARGALRRILARYTGERPEHLLFSYGRWGKPRLEPAGRAKRMEFNVSHSGQIVLIAFASGRRLGVDVEKILPVAENDERLSRSWLSELELSEMSTMDAPARTRAFYSLWTRREAYLKARGEGLSLPPECVEVPCESEPPLESLSESPSSRLYSLRNLEIGPGYAAAVAVEGYGWRLSRWEYR